MATGVAQSAAAVEELTSGASGRIIPVFRKVRRSVLSQASLIRLFLLLHSILLWFLIFLRRSGRISVAAASAGGGVSSPRPRVRKGDEEDMRRRRALAEALEMVCESDGDGGDCGECRWETSVIVGSRKNALFCRSWMPASGEMKGILVIIHGLNEHSGRYAHFARQLTSCNFGAYAMDWIGNGPRIVLEWTPNWMEYLLDFGRTSLQARRYEVRHALAWHEGATWHHPSHCPLASAGNRAVTASLHHHLPPHCRRQPPPHPPLDQLVRERCALWCQQRWLHMLQIVSLAAQRRHRWPEHTSITLWASACSALRAYQETFWGS